jgi:hypothetical protein
LEIQDGPDQSLVVSHIILLLRYSIVAVTMTTINAASPPQKLSLEQVRDVRDSLKKPLTGQQVLIPLGSKAFLPGTLRPSVASSGEEQVVVNDKEMSRQQALDCLQVEIDSLKPPPRTKPVKMKSALRKSKPVSTKPEAMMNPNMPYFEIREEFNGSGEQIGAQAINVSKQLEYLQKQAAGESVVHVPPEAKYDDDDDDQADLDLEEVHVETLKPFNEEEYSSLSERLEELERLEEEANSQQEGTSKIKSMRGKGWSKGFLNAKKPLPKKKIAPTPTSTSTRKPAPPSVPTRKQAPAKEAPTTERKVAFQAEDQVKEIPRVGERSVSEVQKPAARKNIEESVFSGVVRERASAPSAPRQEQPVPKKKLSRFAQQRQEQEY